MRNQKFNFSIKFVLGSQNSINSVTNSITLGPTFCCVSNNTRILRKRVIQTLEPVLGDIKYNITFSCNLLCPNSTLMTRIFLH